MKKLFAVIAAVGLLLGATACETEQATQREKAQQASQSTGETLEQKNLKEKKRREESAGAVRYLYIMSFGKPLGYYVTKGKISSSGSQVGPEMEVIRRTNCSGCDWPVVDSAQDDGSYGDGDPGIFFFTADGTMVVTNLDYIQSDQPLAFNVPQLLK